MFIPAHNVDGCLAVATGTMDNVMYPTSELYAYIDNLLGAGDWTYLQLGKAPSCEQIRVTQAINNTFIVDRGVDNTPPTPYPAQTEVIYVATAASMVDLIAQHLAVNVVLTADNPITVEQIATNQFNLELPTPQFSSDDDSILVTGTYPNYNIVTNKQASGCC